MLLRRPMRVGRPGLLGTVARTAVVAGTATAVVGGMTRRQQERQQQAVEAAAYEQQQAAATQAALTHTAPAPGTDAVAELERLAALKAQGVLTDEEFAAAKAKLLGI